MSETLKTQSRTHFVALVIALIDSAAFVVLVKAFWISAQAQPTKALAIVSGLVVAFAYCMTVGPALILRAMQALPRAALRFALAFPFLLIPVILIDRALTQN